MTRERETLLEGLTPEELAVRSQRGSVEAYGRLVELFEARLFNFLLRKVGSRVDAEDLAQETFMRAWRRIGSYRPRWRFSTWLYTIATRLAISHARRGGAAGGGHVRLSDEDGRAAPMPAGAPEDRGWIWRLVDEVLTEEQRTAVWLRYVEDMAIGEIAAVLGKSHVGVRVMLFRARTALAEHLAAPSAELETEAPALPRPPPPPVPVVKTAAGRPMAGGVL